MAEPVIRLDYMSGTYDVTKLRTGRYYVSTTATGIDNGSVVKFDSVLSTDRDVWKVVAPPKGTTKSALGIVATPELMYDERKKNLDDFTNEAGANLRIYLLESGNIFSLSSDGFTVADSHTVAEGSVVELAQVAGTTLHIATTNTSSTTQVGTIRAIETGLGDGKTYYVVEVA